MGFSGDIESSWRSLKYLLRLTAESANSLFGYWSHDTGGFFLQPLGRADHPRTVFALGPGHRVSTHFPHALRA